MESCNKYDDSSTLSPIISEEEIDAVSSGGESDNELTMLEYISDESQYHLIINRREACFKIRDCIKQGQ